jgi:hypothetical protein
MGEKRNKDKRLEGPSNHVSSSFQDADSRYDTSCAYTPLPVHIYHPKTCWEKRTWTRSLAFDQETTAVQSLDEASVEDIETTTYMM